MEKTIRLSACAMRMKGCSGWYFADKAIKMAKKKVPFYRVRADFTFEDEIRKEEETKTAHKEQD